MQAGRPTAEQGECSFSQRGTHTSWISQQGCIATLRSVLRDQKHPQGPSSGWMQSKTERQPWRWSDTQRLRLPPEPKAKSTSRRAGLRQTKEIKSYTKKCRKFNNIQNYCRSVGSTWSEVGAEPQDQLEHLGRMHSHSFRLIWSGFEASGKGPFPKGCLLHASYSRDFSSLWQCLLHWYLRQQIPAPWNQPHSSLTTLASPAMKFNLWHCCTFHLNFHLERSSVWRLCSLSC